MAVLHLMEKLNPVERAAYVLREAFDYPYKRIADMLETSEANTRQLVSRARKRLSAERRDPVSPAAHRRLLEVFLSAAQTGNLSVLEDVLTADVVSYSDGGGSAERPRFRSSDVLMSPSTSPPSPHVSGPDGGSLGGGQRQAGRPCLGRWKQRGSVVRRCVGARHRKHHVGHESGETGTLRGLAGQLRQLGERCCAGATRRRHKRSDLSVNSLSGISDSLRREGRSQT